VAHSADVDVGYSDRLRRRRAHRAVLNAARGPVGGGVRLRTQPHNRFCVLLEVNAKAHIESR
jgi:glutamate dehydrogenase/leucine dehydrogenase